MEVTVRTIGPFIDKFGFLELRVAFSGQTVSDLLQQLCTERDPLFRITILDEQGNLRPYIKILVNGRGLQALEGLDTRLSNGDVIAILPPVAGGD